MSDSLRKADDESMEVDDDRRLLLKGVKKKGTGRFLEDKDNGIFV